MMASIKLTKLHFSEIKQDIYVEVGIIPNENHVTLQCLNNQLITLDPFDFSLVFTGLFFNINYVEIPQSNKYTSLKKTDLRDFYKHSSLLDQQKMVLDPSCAAQYSSERLKFKALHFKRSQWNTTENKPLAVIVTTSGLCRILQKLAAPSRSWSEICSVDEYILDNILPTIQIRNLSDNIFYEWRITAADWHKSEAILFVSFENGYMAAFTLCQSSTVKLNKYFLTKAALGKICDITSFDNYLYVSSRCGTLQLISVSCINNSVTLTPWTILWKWRDGLICRRVLVTKYSPSTYLTVCNKGSHILVFMLSLSGESFCSTQFYIGEIKVTGLQFISSSEFIVTNITSSVRYFRVELINHRKVKLNEKTVEYDMGSPNLGIYGFASSASSGLLTFILIRNGEYSQHCKYLSNSIFVNISKLDRIVGIERLSKSVFGAMDPSQDDIISLNMDLFNTINQDQDRFFSDILNSPLPDILDNGFLLQLQMKFALLSSFFNIRRFKRKKDEDLTTLIHRLLFNSIQICHIIYRLQHLLSLEFITLSSFQKNSINVFMKRYVVLVHKLEETRSGDRLFEFIKERYLSLFKKSFDVYLDQKVLTWNETCLICNNPTNPDTMRCDRNHKVKRCCVSYKQLPVISSRYCPRCQYYVLEDDSLLQQLFMAKESITCTFCRFLFIEDCI